MATLTELQSWLDALRKARASGVRRVQHGETSTDFKSDAEMASAIADLERQIDAISPGPKRSRLVYFTRKAGS